MSRPYRIVVKKVVEKEVTAEDRSTLTLDLESGLPPERTADLLGQVLERRGWRQVQPGVYEKEREDGATMTCDLAEQEVTTTLEVGRTIAEKRERELRGDTWNWREMREMTDEEMAAIRGAEEEKLGGDISDRKIRDAERALRREAANRLEQSAVERRREVNAVVLETLAEALKEKAKELGQVQSIDETWRGEDYELTIAIAE